MAGSSIALGDAYTTSSVFTNQLGLNDTLSLISAAKEYWLPERDNIWKSTMEESDALALVRDMLLTREDQLVDCPNCTAPYNTSTLFLVFSQNWNDRKLGLCCDGRLNSTVAATGRRREYAPFTYHVAGGEPG